MKGNWVQIKELLGINGLPNTIQGITLRAKNEGWERRRVEGVKGRVYEYNVLSLPNKIKAALEVEKRIPLSDFNIQIDNKDASPNKEKKQNGTSVFFEIMHRLNEDDQKKITDYIIDNGINSLLQLINQQQNKITQHTTQKDALQTQQDAIDTMLAAFPEASRFTVNAWMNFLKLNESDQREIWEQHTKAKRGDTINNTQKES